MPDIQQPKEWDPFDIAGTYWNNAPVNVFFIRFSVDSHLLNPWLFVSRYNAYSGTNILILLANAGHTSVIQIKKNESQVKNIDKHGF